MNCREEVVFGIFPVLAGLPEESNTRRQRFCCSFGAEAPGDSDDLEILSIPCLPTETELIPVGQLKTEFIWHCNRAKQVNESNGLCSGSVGRDASTGTTVKFDGISNAAHTRSMNEREIWLKISNSCAAIADSHSRLPLRIRSSSANAVIRRRSAAKHAARPRRTNMGGGGGGGTTAVLRRVQA